MKKLYFYLSFIMAIVFIFGCQKMDDSYKAFIVKGGLTYPGKATKPIAYAGNKRIKISWLRGTDPSVTKATVFWNNYQDSVNVTIPSTGDTITTTINNIAEREYTFEIVTYNSKGDKSVPAEVLGTVYGDIYQASLLDRPIIQVVLKDNGFGTIQWGAANITDGAYATEITYTDVNNNQITKRYSVKDETSTFPDLKPGNPIAFRTVYLPDSMAIDTFYTAFTSFEDFIYDKTDWKVVAYSTEHDNSPDNRVENIIDGNPSTRWHTNAFSSTYPHFVVIDMQKERTISAFEIYRMTDDDRACDRFELAISNDNINWQVLGDYDFNRLINDGQIYPIASQPKARYFKFTGLSGPQPYMVTGEISVFGH